MQGFAPGDALFMNSFESPMSIQAVYAAGSAGHGTLTLTNSHNTTLAIISMLGDYTGDTFLVSQTGNFFDSLVVLPPAAQHGQAGPGTTAPDNYLWSGSLLGGGWGSARNWTDTTTGTAAAVGPGRNDDVTIQGVFQEYPVFITAAPLVVTGVGEANTLTTDGAVVLDGRFDAAVANSDGGLTVSGLGSVLIAQTIEGSLNVDGATVEAGTTAGLIGVELEHGGVMTAGALSLGFVSVDASSSLRVGSAGTVAAKGALTVESGATVSATGTIVAAVVDQGAIVSSQDLIVYGAISGSGRFLVGSRGLDLVNGASSTIGIMLSGTNEPLYLQDAPDMHAAISGFATGDTIELDGILNAAQAHYNYLGNDFGKLVTTDAGGGTLDVLNLAGDYRGSTFTLTPYPGFGVRIELAAGTAGHPA